ncbi:TPA: ATP-grasp domain-containing protein [Candidatus Woesearchaeota archaeon]|nr:ATP-grasp domain-containing protein [Candidatus Woesearchaeota archaeon]
MNNIKSCGFRKILIANRGEIVLRVINTCKNLGINTVAVYTKGDKNKLIESAADRYVRIQGDSICSTYLNINKIINIAKQHKVDAIHPGYGFLAENPRFAKACKKNGITFIGPSAEVLEKAGHKIEAKYIAKNQGIPTIHGSEILKTEKDAHKFAKENGYPLILKSCSGGGGRGMRIARNREDLISCFSTAMKELENSFKSQHIYAEKCVKAKHIEVQVLADTHGNVIHLFDRECSIQRRFQKLIEEAPASSIPTSIREQIGNTACQLIRSVDYVGAGTVEFLLTPTNEFYFLEINPRIQVEHGVTEMVTGVDIVKEQIRIAQGLPLSIRQEDVKAKGHAIECRIISECARKNFAPSQGTITGIDIAENNTPKINCRIRVDSALYPGINIHHSYDSLLAKLIVWGRSRRSAIKAMDKALKSSRIEGVNNTICFYRFLMRQKCFLEGNAGTDFISEALVQKYSRHSLSPEKVAMIASAIYEHETNHEITFSKPNKWVEEVRREIIRE